MWEGVGCDDKGVARKCEYTHVKAMETGLNLKGTKLNSKSVPSTFLPTCSFPSSLLAPTYTIDYFCTAVLT